MSELCEAGEEMSDEKIAQEREACAKIADAIAAKCLEYAVCAACGHGECMEQRSMAQVARGIARQIRTRGAK